MAHNRRQQHGVPNTATGKEWIIVADKKDEDIIGFLLRRSPGNAKISRVVWADRGPIRLYSSSEAMWQDLVSEARSDRLDQPALDALTRTPQSTT